jgi:hypothetical protein
MYQAVGIGMWEYLKQFQRQLLADFAKTLEDCARELLGVYIIVCALPRGVMLANLFSSRFSHPLTRDAFRLRSLSIKSIKTHYPWSYTSPVHATSFVCVRVYLHKRALCASRRPFEYTCMHRPLGFNSSCANTPLQGCSHVPIS